MKNIVNIFILLCLLTIILTCKKEEIPTLTTTELTNITGISASSGGVITNDGHAKVISRGVCWSKQHNPTIADNRTSDGSGSGSFTSFITGLVPNATYYFRAYASNSIGTAYGNELTIITAAIPPTITTTEITAITPSNALSGGNISSDGGVPITERGVCWNTSPDPTTNNSRTIDGSGTGVFASAITGLLDGTTYYLRAYATNNTGISYGNILTFTTPTFSTQSNFKPTGVIPATESQLLAIPTIESIDTSIVPSSKSLKGLPDHNFIKVPTPGDQDSHNSCTAYTVGYGMLGQAFNVIEGYEDFNGNDRNFSPSYIWNQLNHGFNIGITITQAIDLVIKEGCCKITYMQRDAEIKYQPTTDAKVNAAQYKISSPYYRFSSVDDIDGMKLYLSKNYPIMICINIDENFRNGQFENAPDGRSVWKKYKNKILFGWHSVLICGYDDAIHAFKILNSWGTSWGNNGFVYIDYDFFKSIVLGIPGIGPEIYIAFVQRPILSTNSITEINAQTAKTGGTIYSDWNYPITQRGVCWSTTSNPSIINSKTTDGIGIGNYTSTLTGLLPNTLYFVKAYAINSQGIAYGYQQTFTTIQTPSLPTVSTTPVTVFTATSATVGGNLTADGGSTVTERGVYYGTSQNPVANGTKLQIGGGAGAFSSSLQGLTPKTLYYVAAYAINSQGPNYGSPVSFTTLANVTAPTVTTTPITVFTATSATVEGNVTSDGGATVTERGIYYGTSQNPVTNGTKFQIGNGSGPFSANLTGLTPKTLYFVSAYAINSQGPAYGLPLNFTTLPMVNNPPATPSYLSPINGAKNVSILPTFSWTCSDPENDPMTFDVYIGLTNNPTTLIGTNLTSLNYTPSNALNAGITYYWKVVAKDNHSNSTTGPIWSITTLPIPIANFSSYNTTEIAGEPVYFYDLSKNSPTSWLWNFGDFATSTDPSPNHVYTSAGKYTVSLTVKNINGSNSVTITNFITIISVTGPIVFNPNLTYGSVNDIDGNIYKTVRIGTQVWMAENLKTTRFNDGTNITLLTNGGDWEVTNAPGYGWYYNDEAKFKANYGAFYNGFTLTSNKQLCPIGWHVPTDSEWTILTNSIGDIRIAGGALKETDYIHWSNPNTGATNVSGFTALPGGYQNSGGSGNIGLEGNWWSSSEIYPNEFYGRHMNYNDSYLSSYNEEISFYIYDGYSVRCIEDPKIGDSYQGGLVAYILQSGDPGYKAGEIHGLIAATSDQTISAVAWDNGTHSLLGASGLTLGTGNANSNIIVASLGEGNYAAKLCSDLVVGDYNDWYLPSADELNKIYLNRAIIGGFNTSFYWSSSEVNSSNAYYLNFNTGLLTIGGKANPCRVRAIRAF